MAIKIADEYVNAEAVTPEYPGGSFKNATTGGGTDGTPLEKKWTNDWLGYFQALLAAASIIPSGAPDTATSSQYLEALWFMIRTQATDTVRGAVELATDAEMLTADAVRAVTPARLRLGLSFTLGTEGYIALPTWLSGLVLKWGETTVGAATQNIVFGASHGDAFGTAAYNLQVTNKGASSPLKMVGVSALATTGFTVKYTNDENSPVASNCYWFAIGK